MRHNHGKGYSQWPVGNSQRPVVARTEECYWFTQWQIQDLLQGGDEGLGEPLEPRGFLKKLNFPFVNVKWPLLS